MIKNIIITGASGSLGSSIVKKFYNNKKYNIIAIDQKKNTSLLKKFPKINFFLCDLTSINKTSLLFKKIFKEYKSIDILINNAGFIYNSIFLSHSSLGFKMHSYEEWKKVIYSNLNTVFLATSFVVKNMAEQDVHGTIINISSICARGNVGQVAYSTAKAGIEVFTATLAKELSPFKIRVVAIAPGFFDSDSTKNIMSEKQIANIKYNTPLKRLGKKSEFISAIDFVIKNKFYNGKVLKIDGGFSI